MSKNELEQQVKNSDSDELDLIELALKMWANKHIIIALAVVFMLAFAVKSIYFTADTYTANGVLYVSSKNSPNKNTDELVESEINTARTLSATYTETLKLRSFLMDVSDSIDNKYSWKQIKNMLSVSTINDTELISVSVTAGSARDAYIIAKNIAKLATDKLTAVSNGGNVTIIDKVLKPSSPNGKGTVKNTIFGASTGFVLGTVIVFLIDILDKKIRSCDDIAKRYNVFILGELPK